MARRGLSFEDLARESAGLRTALADRDARLVVQDALIAEQASRIVVLEADVARLRELVEETQRQGKRQASPHSKGKKGGEARRPGRKPGDSYGMKGHREPPADADETYEALLPAACPCCGGDVDDTEVVDQWQEELPVITPIRRRFRVHVGRCRDCGKRVQGRHRLQTSDALGAAGAMVGPRAAAFMASLQKTYGLSHGKVAELMTKRLGIKITAGGVTSVLARLGRRGEATYEALKDVVRRSDVVTPDETGWRIDGLPAWLWVFATNLVVVYLITIGRGFTEATQVLPADWAGTLVRDGHRSYPLYKEAKHQTCLAHLIRRARDMIRAGGRYGDRIPRRLKQILRDALIVRDRRDAGELDAAAVQREVAALTKALRNWLRCTPESDADRRLQKHVAAELKRDAVFTFLRDPSVPATNFRAEQAIRPAVVNRKVWGGNRTDDGAETQQILTSILATIRLQGRDPVDLLTELQHATIAGAVHVLTQLVPTGLDHNDTIDSEVVTTTIHRTA